MTKRLLFVCPSGHIFRATAYLKFNRERLCKTCGCVVSTGGHRSIATARKAARSAASDSPLTFFVRGNLVTLERNPPQKKAA